MIEAISLKAAERLKTASKHEASVAVLAYAIGIYINTFGVIIAMLIIGFLSGFLMESILSLAGFGILRAISRGFHLKSLTWCAIVTILLLTLSSVVTLSDKATITMTISSVIIMLLEAPTYKNNESIKARTSRKVAATVLVLSNLFFISGTLAMVFTIQAILLIMKGGEAR